MKIEISLFYLVMEMPTIILSSKLLNDGLQLNLSCKTNSYPNPSVDFIFNGSHIGIPMLQNKTEGNQYESHMQINVSKHFIGQFKCESNNIVYEKESKNEHLDVNCKSSYALN